jgi:hypothetical protein
LEGPNVKKSLVAAIAASAFVFAASAAAALVPGVFDPGHTGCPTSTFSNGTLHLAKNCASTVNASAGADITGVTGSFTSASFTLASTSQCQGGSPRFNITTTTKTYFLGCNNVTPTVNGDGSATYVFTAATIANGGNQVEVPVGDITAAQVLIDIQGTADLRDITLNGIAQVPAQTGHHPKGDKGDKCKHGQWRDRHFRNQGQCVSHDRHERNRARQHH